MWKNININKQNIKYDTGNAVLINCPHKSQYNGFSFWHPSKFVKEGRNSNAVSICYNDEFKFKLIKYGKGKANRNNLLDQVIIDVEEFEEMFSVMNENIVSPYELQSYLIVEEPKKVDVNVEVAECLKNNS